jgi:hypothetical protein
MRRTNPMNPSPRRRPGGGKNDVDVVLLVVTRRTMTRVAMNDVAAE